MSDGATTALQPGWEALIWQITMLPRLEVVRTAPDLYPAAVAEWFEIANSGGESTVREQSENWHTPSATNHSDALAEAAHSQAESISQPAGTHAFPPGGYIDEPEDSTAARTLDRIDAFRSTRDGWDGSGALAPSNESLDSAQDLYFLLRALPAQERPVFAVDADGLPSFAVYTDQLYLHLTIDSPGLLSWYAVRADTEYFGESVVFTGGSLPTQLRELLDLS